MGLDNPLVGLRDGGTEHQLDVRKEYETKPN